MVGETHVLHDAVLNAGIHDLVAANGAMPGAASTASPCRRDVPPACAGCTGRAPAQMLRAAWRPARRGDVYPLLLGAYGCGPNSLIEHLFDDLLEEYPHTVLESDGHGGTAGYVTRVQAFLHAVHAIREAQRRPRRGAADATRCRAARWRATTSPCPHSFEAAAHGPFYFGNMGGGLGRQLAAAMRGAGLDARSSAPPTPAALRARRRRLLGQGVPALPAHLGHAGPLPEQDGAGDTTAAALFLSVGNGFQACRANLFPLAEQIGWSGSGWASASTSPTSAC